MQHDKNQTDVSPCVLDLEEQSSAVHDQCAELLVEEFGDADGWPTIDKARQEVATVIQQGFARAMLENETVLGWIGGLPEYNGKVWELHPLVVRAGHRRRGLGRALVASFEHEAARRGALTATLGTDDITGATSLANARIYDDLPRHIAEIRDLGTEHPFLFYRKLGYVITGVMPDANGRGRPDIYMSKPLG